MANVLHTDVRPFYSISNECFGMACLCAVWVRVAAALSVCLWPVFAPVRPAGRRHSCSLSVCFCRCACVIFVVVCVAADLSA